MDAGHAMWPKASLNSGRTRGRGARVHPVNEFVLRPVALLHPLKGGGCKSRVIQNGRGRQSCRIRDAQAAAGEGFHQLPLGGVLTREGVQPGHTKGTPAKDGQSREHQGQSCRIAPPLRRTEFALDWRLGNTLPHRRMLTRRTPSAKGYWRLSERCGLPVNAQWRAEATRPLPSAGLLKRAPQQHPAQSQAQPHEAVALIGSGGVELNRQRARGMQELPNLRGSLILTRRPCQR